MGELAIEFFKVLKTAHRIYGQYKRIAGFESFYGVGSFEELTGYEAPQKITRGSIRRLKDYINEMRKKKEHYEYASEKGWEEALTASWEEFKESNQAAQLNCDTSTWSGSFAQDGLDSLYTSMWQFGYRYAMDKWRTNFKRIKNKNDRIEAGQKYKKSIESFLAKFGEELKRLAYSVIDTKKGGFNTNARWFVMDSEGAAGRAKFRNFIDQLFEAWWVPEQAPFVRRLAR